MDARPIPSHLRELVVTQDYAQYTEQDHAVWRFAVQHTHRRLLRRAHAAYAPGFAAAGITLERIPRIAEISDKLSAFGWSAVCVDGFIPPRAFQGFQAQRILPIAADIRTRKHLTYTPAPDIVHEAAGHAPFLSDPSYARFLMRIGEVGSRAFSSEADRAIYEAIYTLSEVKENPASTAQQVDHAERAFTAAMAAQGSVSEAAQLARLYWWTVEYGLAGTLRDYRLYGAGLLSSIGEGYFCDEPAVRKLPLSAACVDVGYDITRPQPQLFVAEDFDHLSSVLDTVAATMSQTLGGALGLERARDSGELATVTLDSGVQVAGYVREARIIHARGRGDAREHKPWLVQLDGPCALATASGVLTDLRGADLQDAYTLVLGALEDGTELSRITPDALRRHVHGDRLALKLRDSVSLDARLDQLVVEDGRVLLAVLSDLHARRGDDELVRSAAPYLWALGTEVTSVSAGGFAGHQITSRRPSVRVPKPRQLDVAETEMLALYEQSFEALRSLRGAELGAALARICERLDAAYPDEWLLRYEILAGLTANTDGAAEAAQLQRQLIAQLEALEIRYAHREPIATGLKALRALMEPEP